MSKTKDFFNNQHSLQENTKNNYRKSLKKFKSLTGENFEDVFLDQEKVHNYLNLLSKEFNDSTWNHYLTLYKRLAKFLSDPEDEVTPNFWRKIKRKKILPLRH